MVGAVMTGEQITAMAIIIGTLLLAIFIKAINAPPELMLRDEYPPFDVDEFESGIQNLGCLRHRGDL